MPDSVPNIGRLNAGRSYAIWLICIGAAYASLLLLPVVFFTFRLSILLVIFINLSILIYLRLHVTAPKYKQIYLNYRAFASIGGNRDFNLYLRSFSLDGTVLFSDTDIARDYSLIGATPNPEFMDGLQEVVRTSASDDTVAIGWIGSKHQLLPHISFADDQWKSGFETLARQAKFVIMVPGTTSGALWELDWLVRNKLNQTIFLMPPISAHNNYADLVHLEVEFCDQVARVDVADLSYAANVHLTTEAKIRVAQFDPYFLPYHADEFSRVAKDWHSLQSLFADYGIRIPGYFAEGRVFRIVNTSDGMAAVMFEFNRSGVSQAMAFAPGNEMPANLTNLHDPKMSYGIG